MIEQQNIETNIQQKDKNLFGNDCLESDWTIKESQDLYNINRWGEGYFSINSLGHLTVLPKEKSADISLDKSIDIAEIIKEMKQRGIAFPAVIRFNDILKTQVNYLCETFNKTIKEAGFKGKYYGVFPTKVNQIKKIIREVVEAGKDFNYGLEAGSKAELLLSLAMNKNENSLTIANGYKDREFLELSLFGRKLGRQIFVVIEKFSELPELLMLAQKMEVKPLIGIRAKLSTQGTGKWSTSSGDQAKFGLTIPEILKAIEFLKLNHALDYLKLFHFHIGSQVTDIRTIKEAITEGARIYSKMVKLGVPLEYFDVGGGMGIDYSGSKTVDESSINYDIDHYVGDVVYILKQICDLEKVKHPNIVTETGRAVCAHHSCVIVNIFGNINVSNEDFETTPIAGEHVLVEDMRTFYQGLCVDNFQETYNDALLKKDEAINAFKLGILSLDERAKIETLYWKTCKKVFYLGRNTEYMPPEIQELETSLAERYLGNFSVFQSIPDYWAIKQLLPIVPITHLHKMPTKLCSFADITCDSDGRIDTFIDNTHNKSTLPVHDLNNLEEYNIGIFLTGAYQDVMGDQHNLFGRVNEVHVYQDDQAPNNFFIEEVIEGNRCQDVLSDLHYDPHSMTMAIDLKLKKQVEKGDISLKESIELSNYYKNSLQSYTYLKHKTHQQEILN